ncbi:hypothetical protein [Comamonas sp. MYb396]|uniref:hypothetical protein n=1 Tax=Comamonas sp. MYb396 TaxID=2745302 RepID=UPI0030993993
MSLSFYALLPPNQKAFSLEQIQEALAPLLSSQSKPSFDFEDSPFGGKKNLLVVLPGWWVRFFKEQDEYVLSDSAHIAEITAGAPSWVKSCGNRIRVLFGEDPSRTYTNEVLFISDWLTQEAKAAVYVPEEKIFW